MLSLQRFDAQVAGNTSNSRTNTSTHGMSRRPWTSIRGHDASLGSRDGTMAVPCAIADRRFSGRGRMTKWLSDRSFADRMGHNRFDFGTNRSLSMLRHLV